MYDYQVLRAAPLADNFPDSHRAEVERLTPTAVLQATRAINAASAFHAAELLGIPTLAIPYQAAGFEALAKELIAITRAEPTTTDPDREIVDGWAEKLGLSRWYVWKTP
jgi:hypothetical protein